MVGSERGCILHEYVAVVFVLLGTHALRDPPPTAAAFGESE
jgi:hypothetical protein